LSGFGVWSPRPRKPALGLSCRCPLDMHMVLSVGLRRSYFSCSYSCSDIKRWCRGGKSRTSSTLIIHWPALRPVTSSYLRLVAPLAVSMADVAMVPLSLQRPVVSSRETSVSEESTREALVQEMLGADNASLGTISVEVDGASPGLSDDTRVSLCDLVMCGTGLGMLGSVAPGDAIPTPKFSGATGPGVVSHPVFKAKTKCSSHVCPGSSCHTYGQNVSTEYQCLYHTVSYYKNYYMSRKD
jgi:hypothetical protein